MSRSQIHSKVMEGWRSRVQLSFEMDDGGCMASGMATVESCGSSTAAHSIGQYFSTEIIQAVGAIVP